MTTPTLREAAMAVVQHHAAPLNAAWNRKERELIAALRLALTAPEQSPADGGQETSECEACGGSGWIEYGEFGGDCAAIHGMGGRMPDAPGKHRCDDCGGTGRITQAEDTPTGEPVAWADPRDLEDATDTFIVASCEKRQIPGGDKLRFKVPLFTTPAAPTSGEPRQAFGDGEIDSRWYITRRSDTPQAFIDYVARNYYGEVVFHDPAWHAKRLYRAAMSAAPGATPPSAAQAEGAPAFTDEHLSYVDRYGGFCRDCADENGVCPSRGLPCADSEKAIRFVFDALAYGIKHKYISNPFTAAPEKQDSEWNLFKEEFTAWKLARLSAAPEKLEGPNHHLLEWAVSRWRDEVEHRPLMNKNRRALDDAWRQVIRFAGVDPEVIVGPSHDQLLQRSQS